MNTYTFKLKSLTNTISNKVKGWQKSAPNAPTMKDYIAGWKQDIDNLTNFKSSVSPNIQLAKKAIENAWDNRDNPSVMLSQCKIVKECLDNAIQELEVPAERSLTSVNASKAAYTNRQLNEMYEPDEFKTLYRIKTIVNGSLLSDENDIRAIRDAIGMAEHLGYVNAGIKSHTDFISNNLFRSTKLIGSARVKTLQNVDKAIEDATLAVERQNNVGIRKLPISNEEKYVLIDHVQTLVNSFNRFNQPTTVFPQALKSANVVVRAYSLFDDPVGMRIAKRIQEHVQQGTVKTQSIAAKFVNQDLWRSEQINVHFEQASSLAQELLLHLKRK